jgi:hypothetical protein
MPATTVEQISARIERRYRDPLIRSAQAAAPLAPNPLQTLPAIPRSCNSAPTGAHSMPPGCDRRARPDHATGYRRGWSVGHAGGNADARSAASPARGHAPQFRQTLGGWIAGIAQSGRSH